MKSLILSAAIAIAIAAPAAQALDVETLRLHAALSKLEANKAEAAGAVLLAAMPDHSDEMYEEAVEDFESDSAQILGYIDAVLAMELTDEQRAGVESFAAGWTEAAEAARPILAGYEDSPEYRERVFDWWESLDGLDDTVDDMLEELLAANGVSFDGDLED